MRTATVLGALGSVIVAVASYGAPTIDPTSSRPLVLGAGAFDLAHWAYLAGLLAVTVAWLLLGRAVLAGELSARALQWITAVWSVPMLGAAPIGSRDVWAYAAQATVLRDGGNPYANAPAAFPGPHLPYVSGEWRTEPSPYGPMWLVLTLLAVTLTGTHVLVTALLLRVLCAVGLLLAARTVPIVASRLGGSPATAVWLVCANPVVVVIALGGVHNDLLVGGLMALSLWLVTNDGPWWQTVAPAVVASTVAAEIKLPAAALLAFLPYLWLRRSTPRTDVRSFVTAALGVVVGTAVTAAVIAAATGLGFGWLHQLNHAASGLLWLSIPLVAAWAWAGASGHGVQLHDDVTAEPGVVTAVTVVLVIALLTLWILAWRRDAAVLLAIVLGVSVTISATVQPWYLPWALLGGAAVLTSRTWLIMLAAASVCLAWCVHPNGGSWLAKAQLPAVAVCAAVLVAVVLARRRADQSLVRTTSSPPSA